MAARPVTRFLRHDHVWNSFRSARWYYKTMASVTLTRNCLEALHGVAGLRPTLLLVPFAVRRGSAGAAELSHEVK